MLFFDGTFSYIFGESEFAMPHRFAPLAAALAAALLASVGHTHAQTKAPKAQLWIDLSTSSFAGMPETDFGGALGGSGLGGALGGLIGRMGGGAVGLGTPTSYGQARGLGIASRVVDVALYNSLKPGVEASQAIPAGMRMGDALPLVPPAAPAAIKNSEPGEPQEGEVQRPKGRILMYWGCGAAVAPGQPRVIDLGGSPAAFAGAFSGRFVPDRGARVNTSYALYPNEKNKFSVPRDASLVGEHRVLGDGVPASMKFNLGAAQDLMPRIELQAIGAPQDAIALNWQPVAQARAYYLHAFGTVGEDMVMWSSADTGDTGLGLFDYLPNATIDRWLRERVLLQPTTSSCQVPRGIFAGAPSAKGGEGGGLVRMVAYGSESNIAYPPRPADPKAPWEPEWAVRVRVKSQTTAFLGGAEDKRPGMAGSGRSPAATEPQGQEAAPPNPINLLKGLFGR